MFKIQKRAVVTLSTRLKDKSEKKLLREEKIARVAIMSPDLFSLKAFCLSKNTQVIYIYIYIYISVSLKFV